MTELSHPASDADPVKLESTPGKSQARPLWPSLLTTVFATVAGAAIAIAGQYFLANAQAANEHAAQLETKREAYYSAFMTQSNVYANAATDIEDYLKAGHDVSELPNQSILLNKFRHERYIFRGDINNVYIYGTHRAWTAAQKIIETLPNTRGQESTFLYEPESFDLAYRKFEAVFCEEAQPDRQDCATFAPAEEPRSG